MTTDSDSRATSAATIRAATGSKGGRDVIEVLQFPDIPRLELDELLEQLRDRADDVLATQGRLRGLLRANAAVAADLSIPALLRHIVDEARDLLSAQFAAFVAIGPDLRLEQFVHSGLDDELIAQIGGLPCGQGVLELLTAEPPGNGLPAQRGGSAGFAPGHPPIGDFLGVPVRIGTEICGDLYLRAPTGRVFGLEDQQLVTALAAAGGVAFANARLLAESEQRRVWLTASSHLTNRLLSADTQQPLTCVTQAAAATADADFAILLVQDGADQLRVAAATGDVTAGLVNRIVGMDGSHSGQAIRTGAAEMVSNYRGDSAMLGPNVTIGPVMVVPLTAGQRMIGALTLGRLAGRDRFTRAELDMATTFGTHAAVAIALAEARDAQLSDARLADHDRIAVDLHDHVIGELFALGMGLAGLASATQKPLHVERIGGYVETLDRVIGTIRTTIFQLQRHQPQPAGLQQRILHICEAHAEQLGFDPRPYFSGPIEVAVDQALAGDILAVTREALSNCARHARAGNVTVSLVVADDVVTLEVTDDGQGIGASTRSSGLANMRRRAEQNAGSLTVTEPDNGGTRLTWLASCARRE